MATVKPTITKYGDDAVLFTWALTSTDSEGHPIGPDWVSYSDRCVQVTGTQGGAVAALQGSNDGTNYDAAALSDLFGGNMTALTVASGGALFSIAEIPLYTRPILTTVGSGAAVTYKIFCRKVRSGRAIGG